MRELLPLGASRACWLLGGLRACCGVLGGQHGWHCAVEWAARGASAYEQQTGWHLLCMLLPLNGLHLRQPAQST